MREIKVLLLIGGLAFLLTGKLIIGEEKKTSSQQGLVGYWSFDEDSEEDAYDISGLENHGEVKGAKLVKGIMGNAFEFEGAAYLDFGNKTSLYPGKGSLSVEGWAFHRDYTYPKTTFPIGTNTCYKEGNPGWQIGHGYFKDGITLSLNDGTKMVRGTLNWDKGYKPEDIKNKWAHIAVIFNRDTGKAYSFVNGVKQSGEVDISSVTGEIIGTENIKIGNMVGWQMDGLIDEVRIYNRVLSADEIKASYDKGAQKRK